MKYILIAFLVLSVFGCSIGTPETKVTFIISGVNPTDVILLAGFDSLNLGVQDLPFSYTFYTINDYTVTAIGATIEVYENDILINTSVNQYKSM